MQSIIDNTMEKSTEIKLRECREAFEAWERDPKNKDWKHMVYPAFHGGYHASSRYTDKILEMAAEGLRELVPERCDIIHAYGDTEHSPNCRKCKWKQTLWNIEQYIGKE